MNLELLNKNIKQKCREAGINISQLEKELKFSSGSISKWGQSSPSIEKVMAVADYFHITLDQICGINQEKEDIEFLEALIRKTNDGDVVWVPCSGREMSGLSFCPAQSVESFFELYCASYNEGKFYIGFGEETFEFYIRLDNAVCMRQQENFDQMKELWGLIKAKEQELKERIDRYKEGFVNS